jgi:hypothetical protein
MDAGPRTFPMDAARKLDELGWQSFRASLHEDIQGDHNILAHMRLAYLAGAVEVWDRIDRIMSHVRRDYV